MGFWKDRTTETTASWREMASGRTLGLDLAAGVSVACVGLPLNLALALACGLPAGVGLVTGVVAGLVASTFSGSRLQVTGPEAALVPLMIPIVLQFGHQGLIVATFGAGLLQIALGLLRVGRVARLMPVPVVGGFMAGIGLILFGTQFPRALGLPEELSSITALFGSGEWIGQVVPADVLLGAITIGVMVLLPRFNRTIPAVLVALVVVTALAWGAGWNIHQVGELPRGLPTPQLPDFGAVSLTALLPAILSLTVLASLGSLLSMTALDSLLEKLGRPQNSSHDQELVAQGLANVVAALIGGMPVMGAIVRSSVAVQGGARTRATPMIQAVVLLLAILVAAPVVAHVPVAALAGILLVVGVRLVNVGGILTMWKHAKISAGILLATAVAILATDFLAGVAAGLVLALVIYLRRYGKLGIEQQALWIPTHGGEPRRLRMIDARQNDESPEVALARIVGPILFLNHSRLQEVIANPPWPKYLLLDLTHVPMVDGSGLSALTDLGEFLAGRGVQTVICGAARDVRGSLERGGVLTRFGETEVFPTAADALQEIARREGRPAPDKRALARFVAA